MEDEPRTLTTCCPRSPHLARSYPQSALYAPVTIAGYFPRPSTATGHSTRHARQAGKSGTGARAFVTLLGRE